MSDPTAHTHQRLHPNTAPDPAALTQEEYVELQLERSRLMSHEDCAFRAAHLFDLLCQHIGAAEFAALNSILCVGCRNGYELDAAEASGLTDVVGIDLHSLDPRIVVMDMHQMTFNNGRFDLVLASHSLEHAKAPERAGAELRRVTRPGGYIIVEVPIYYGTRGADLWDYESPERVVELLGEVEVVWTEIGPQLDGPQEVARVIARATNRTPTGGAAHA